MIVMLGTSPDAYNGIATVVRNYRDFGILAEWKVAYLVTHVQGSRFAKARAALVALSRLLRMILIGQVRLLHVHMASRVSIWRKVFFILTGMIFRVPYLVHLHCSDLVEFFEHENGKWGKFIMRFVFTHATFVITLSPSIANAIREIVPTTRTVTLFNSVPLPAMDFVNTEERASKHDSCKPPLILFLGQVGKRKGAFDLIRAVSLLTVNFKMVIAGDGELKLARALSEELGVSEKIQFTGWLERAEKDELLARAAIFVLPSYDEAMPMALLEAMSWSVPVVTTPVGGIPEVVTEGQEGLLVNPGDIPGLIRALERLLGAPSLRRMLGQKGRHKIELEYSMEVLRPQLEQLWIYSGVLEPESVARRRQACV
ncbi:Glycosyltransferase involved in cell wall bisynthesis [Nitrosovibrio sp. Nv4]|nr:Glycosyltransferase involved in cell wall bisynthesis [Nitrosovibrio sp. Nv4]